jgi:hypothetical protein
LTAAARGAYHPARTMAQRVHSRPRTAKPRAHARAGAIVDLGHARDARRLREFQARCRAVDEVNRRALARLFQTGVIYTRSGARLGRDLLLAHQHLLRVSDLLARIEELPDPVAGGDSADLYVEAQGLLARTSELAARCGLVLARER